MNNICIEFHMIWKLFLERVVSVKTFTLLLLLTIIYHIFLSPIKVFSMAVQYPVSPWIFPFLISDVYFVILFMAAVVYYFSDVPFMKEWAMYQVIRTGRVKWVCGQIGSLVLSSFAFVLVAVLETGLILLPNLTLNEGWGKVLYTLSITNASAEYQIPFLISYDIINQLAPLEALGISVFMSGLVILFIVLLMFSISLYISRLWANITAMLFVILPIVIENIGDTVPWLVYCSPISWIRISETLVQSAQECQKLNLMLCSVLLIVVCIGLSSIIIWKIKKVDFKFIKED